MQATTEFRHAIIMALIWGAAVTIGFGAAWMIYHRVLQGEHLTPPDPRLERLQPWLAGETLNLPKAPGFWLLPAKQSEVLADLGEPLGSSKQVNLCVQRIRSTENPLGIYDIAMVGDWADLEGAQARRKSAGKKLLLNPLVIPTAFKPGMPTVVIAGRASDDVDGSALTIFANGGAQWHLLTDAGSASAANDGAQSRLSFKRDAWLLWRKPAADGAVAKSRGDEAEHFDHALHFHRSMDDAVLQAQRADHHGCAAGTMDIALLTSSEKTLQPQGLGVALNVFPKVGGMVTARLSSGLHAFPSNHIAVVEDKELFDAAVAHGLIRLNAAGRVEVVPAEVNLAQKAGVSVAGWEQIDTSQKEVARLVKRLHTKRDGDFVRAQIRHFNTENVWAALSVQSGDTSVQATVSDLRHWEARADGQSVAVQTGLPDVAARLFDAPLAGWSSWLRVAMPARDKPTELVQMSLRLSSEVKHNKHGFEVLSLGKIMSVVGATMRSSEDFCTGPGCSAKDVVQRTHLSPISTATSVVITLRPEARFNDLHPDAEAFRHVQLRDKKLAWVQAPVATTTASAAEVTLTARDGSVLFKDGQPSAQASTLGLASLVGISSAHTNGVAGVLARLGSHGQSRVAARMTIDSLMQNLSQQILDCVGMQGGKWVAKSGSCDLTQNPDVVPGRRTGLVLLDAANGEILVVAGSPGVPDNSAAQALIDFDRFNPGHSPLRLQGLQHDGRVENSPGSSFKLVTALGLELAATKSKTLDALLDGASPAFIDGAASKKGFQFRMSGSCYPHPCGGKEESNTDIVNFKHHQPKDYLNEKGHFGLRESLSSSMNTWFSWLTEMNDGTLAGSANGGVPDAVALGNSALDAERPVFAMAHRLGFERSIKLDGGLLPADFHWQAWDALHATPSQFDFIIDRPQVRWHAIGSRMHVTPLQMASVAGSIGSGFIVQPKLLAELDGKQSGSIKGEALGVRLDRIRAGMKAVTEIGTAKSAFAGAEMRQLRGGVYGKTGTIPRSKDDNDKLNMGWFVGYVEPGTIQGETRRLAFATFISRTPETGGSGAAKVIADFLTTLAQHNATVAGKRADNVVSQ